MKIKLPTKKIILARVAKLNTKVNFGCQNKGKADMHEY